MPRKSTNKFVHRNLFLVTPQMEGPDVRELQESINALINHYKMDWRGVQEDGDYGIRTRREAAFVAKLIGLDKSRIHAIGKAGRITEEVQALIRNPEKRSRQDRQREEARAEWRRKLREEHESGGMRRATDWMVKHKGVNEEPPGSNGGPFPIDEVQSYFGLSHLPWCGSLVGYAIEVVGGIDTGTWWPHARSIREDAVAGRNGLIDINPNNADIDCVGTLFDGGDDHVIKVRGKVSNGLVSTVEGNTSSSFQDADGGIIETKQRPVEEFTCMARLTIA